MMGTKSASCFAFFFLSITSAYHQSAQSVRLSSDRPTNPFYDRCLERSMIKSEFSKPPIQIMVLIGPRSCGKTALIKHCLREEGLDNSMCYVDCRGFSSTSPSEFANRLLEEGLPLFLKNLPSANPGSRALAQIKSFVKQLLRLGSAITASDTLEAFSIAVDGKKLVEVLLQEKKQLLEQGKPVNLQTVLACYDKLINLWNAARTDGKLKESQYLVLAIDEANVLMDWPRVERDTLLRFLVKMTKQETACHALLCTSDFGFQSWLNEAIGAGFWQPYVLGDFPEEEARLFLTEILRETIVVDDSDWRSIFEVCGGNAGALLTVARKYDPRETWQEALDEISNVRYNAVGDAIFKGGDGFSGTQFAAAAILLLENTNNVVTEEVMLTRLGEYCASGQDRDAVLAGLIKANLLSLRPYSRLARDIPKIAYGYPALKLVTASSAIDLYCMRRLEEKLVKQANFVEPGAN